MVRVPNVKLHTSCEPVSARFERTAGDVDLEVLLAEELHRDDFAKTEGGIVRGMFVPKEHGVRKIRSRKLGEILCGVQVSHGSESLLKKLCIERNDIANQQFFLEPAQRQPPIAEFIAYYALYDHPLKAQLVVV
jgi:hypothetical protein